MNATKRPDNRSSIRKHLLVGGVAMFLLVGGVGGWATTTELAGAVIAPGQLVVESSVKKVQHPSGGVVGELRVRDGDRVSGGAIVIRLDETVTRANLAMISKSLDQFEARQARLEAEREDLSGITFPDRLLERREDSEIARLMTSEERLMSLRREARQGQKGQLGERIAQLREEAEGLIGQIEAKDSELELIGQELEGVRRLWEKDLIPLQRLTALQRDAARISGERSQLTAMTAQTRGRVSEINLQILQIDQDLRSQVAGELSEIEARISELVERKVAAEDQLRRVDIRAPQDGTVHQLAVHTVGGVIAPGEEIMLIVPEADALIVEVMIEPQAIDQVRHDLPVLLRFSAFNQRTTPEINGAISHIAADLTTDQRTGMSFYTARVAVPEEEMTRLGEVRLLPGMPVEAFIQTGERTALSYLVKPLSDQLNRAWRGE